VELQCLVDGSNGGVGSLALGREEKREEKVELFKSNTTQEQSSTAEGCSMKSPTHLQFRTPVKKKRSGCKTSAKPD
jgi:hypothetical protein